MIRAVAVALVVIASGAAGPVALVVGGLAILAGAAIGHHVGYRSGTRDTEARITRYITDEWRRWERSL